MSRVFTPGVLLAVFLLSPAFCADWSGSELILSEDYQMEHLKRMPVASRVDGMCFSRHDDPDLGAVEWRVELAVPAGKPAIQYDGCPSADFVVRFPTAAPVTLHWNRGSQSKPSDFQPLSTLLAPEQPVTFVPFGGRSSDGVLPYFHLAADGGGLIAAVGWTGSWKAVFTETAPGVVRVTIGLQEARFELPAGDRVRLPSVLLMSYSGTRMDGQNRFRRLMKHLSTPAGSSAVARMPVAASVHGLVGFNDTTEKNLTELVDILSDLQLPVDTFWLDAGWTVGGFPFGQGNPDADPARFPDGLAPLGRAVQDAGWKFLVWFEPERVMAGTWLDRSHPEWLLHPGKLPDGLSYLERDGFRLLDMGSSAARRWALNRISRIIDQAGVSIYRQDFNAPPAFFWSAHDDPNQPGLTEVRYITGLYKFLDELQQRHPAVLLDNCASGGRRLDFEMMRRCVVLWRSDNCWDDPSFPRNVQAMTYGLSLWLPLHGLGAYTTDDVALRSGMGTCASFPVNFRDPQAVAALRRHLDRYLKVRHLFAADFYPLSDWSLDPGRWLAFQFHDPQHHEGLIQAFRGDDADLPSQTLYPRGLDPERIYQITDWDDPDFVVRRTGRELTSDGLTVRAGPTAQAIVIRYCEAPH